MAEKELSTRANISLSAEHLKAVQKLQMKVGSKVRLVLYGELTGMSQHAPADQTELATPAGGSIDMSVSSLRAASNNEIAELFDEEFDG